MFFKNIVGQKKLIRQLTANVRTNRISHAQLFLGPEGSGHLPLVLALSTYIHCQNRGEDDACGICPSCLKMKKLEHPDIHFFMPVAPNQEHKKDVSSKLFYPNWRKLILSKPYFSYVDWLKAIGIENKQAIINTEDCNEIIRRLGLKSFESPYKIVILYMVEKLYRDAAPKLLKILEEPPENTLFLLVSENKDQILSTILSRTQLLRIPRPSDIEVEQVLISQFGATAERAHQMARLAAGNVCDAFQLIDDTEDLFEHFDPFRTWMRLCYGKKVQNLLTWVETIAQIGREKQKSFLRYGIGMFRLCMISNYQAKDIMNLDEEERVFVEKFASYANPANILQLVKLLEDAIFHIDRNANPRILFADVSFQISKLLQASVS